MLDSMTIWNERRRGRPPIRNGAHGEIHYRKPESRGGSWIAWCRARDMQGNLVRVKRSRRTKQEAYDAVLEALYGPVAGERLTSLETVESYIAKTLARLEASDRSRNTIREYGYALESVKKDLSKLRLATTTTRDLQRVVTEAMQSRGNSLGKKIRSALVALFDTALLDGLVESNPAKAVLVSVVEPRKRLPDAPATIDIHAIRKALRNDPVAVQSLVADGVDILLGTGLRPAEMVGIRREDVDEKTRKIRISGSVEYVNGVAQRVPTTKSASTQRVLVVPAFVIEAVTHASSLYPQAETIICNAYGRPLHPSSFTSKWRKVQQRLALPDVSPMDFRKYVGTVVAKEAGLQAAADQLGHTNTSTPLKHYVQDLPATPDRSGLLEL